MSTLFDFTDVKESGFAPIPSGSYNVISDDVTLKETKSGGEMINIKFKILDGPHEGRFIFSSFNIRNDNPKAVEIGLGQLKSFIRIAGCPMQVQNWTDLVGYKACAVVKIQTSDQYGDQAKISYFKAMSDSEQSTGQATSPF